MIDLETLMKVVRRRRFVGGRPCPTRWRRIAASAPNRNDNLAVAVLVPGETTVAKSLAALVGLPSRLGCCLCRVSSTDYLEAGAGSRLRLDDFTFHGRGILNHVERCRRLADGLVRLSRE